MEAIETFKAKGYKPKAELVCGFLNCVGLTGAVTRDGDTPDTLGGERKEGLSIGLREDLVRRRVKHR